MPFYHRIKKDPSSEARLGKITTAHGEINTPIFMPVGTRATVKAMSPRDLESLNVEIILGNTYHLMLRPGDALIRKAGGLHQFENWKRPILTDSGGFQVFSLAKLRKIRPNGVEFSSHIDGSRYFLGPKESMAIQRNLGSDIVMAFDECTPYPATYEEAYKSLRQTLEWEEISREQKLDDHQNLFGIVQGSVYRDLRELSAHTLVDLDFAGYSIGGLSVGEPEAQMLECIEWVTKILPEEKPRYLMGVGTPRQIYEAVRRGVDMFDCVMPTRLARHGSAFLRNGTTIPIKAAKFREDFSPVDAQCQCYTCRNFTKAYLRHLFNVDEILGIQLMTLHNIHFFIDFMRRIREAIANDSLEEIGKTLA